MPANPVITTSAPQPVHNQSRHNTPGSPAADDGGFNAIISQNRALAEAQIAKIRSTKNLSKTENGTEIAPKDIAREFTNKLVGEMWQIIVAESLESSGMQSSLGEKTFSEVLAGKRVEDSTQFDSLTEQILREIDREGNSVVKSNDEHFSAEEEQNNRQSELPE